MIRASDSSKRPLHEQNDDSVASLMPKVYDELRSLAAAQFAQERQNHTLQPTAVIHEVYLRLAQAGQLRLSGRAHFFVIASHAIRRVLVDHARKRDTAKRGTGRHVMPLHMSIETDSALSSVIDLLSMEDALSKLNELSPRQCQVVEMRVFGGLTFNEIAEALDVSLRTTKEDWSMARAWLRILLQNEDAT